MKSRKISPVILLCAAALLLALCACGNSGGSEDAPAAPTAALTPTPEPTPAAESDSEAREETDAADPLYFVVNDLADGFPTRYDLSKEESAALLEMVNNISPVEKSEEQTWEDWPDSVQYTLSWLKDGLTKEKMTVYEGDVIWLEDAYYICTGVDHSLIYDICSQVRLIEKSEEDVSGALQAFREYFAEWEEKGCSIVELRYDEKESSEWTNRYIHDGRGKQYMDEDNAIALFLVYEAAAEEYYYNIVPGSSVLIFLTRENPDAEWVFAFSEGDRIDRLQE